MHTSEARLIIVLRSQVRIKIVLRGRARRLLMILHAQGAGHGGNLLHGRFGRFQDAILGGIGKGVVRGTTFESPNVQFAVDVLRLLRQHHGIISLAILHVAALGLGHEGQMHDALVTSVPEYQVEGQYALIVLAYHTLRKRKQQRREGTLRRAKDDGSVEWQQSPTQLPICLITTDTRGHMTERSMAPSQSLHCTLK